MKLSESGGSGGRARVDEDLCSGTPPKAPRAVRSISKFDPGVTLNSQTTRRTKATNDETGKPRQRSGLVDGQTKLPTRVARDSTGPIRVYAAAEGANGIPLAWRVLLS